MSAPKNVPTSAPPRTEVGTTASTHIPPEGARTGAAGPVNAESPAPGRSTSDEGSIAIVGSGPKGAFTAFTDRATLGRWLDEGFLHQHHSRQVPTHHQVCDCDAEHLRVEKLNELLHEDDGHAGLSLVIPALFAAALLLIAGVSGKLGYLWHHLPLTSTPNGFTLFCLVVLALFCWRRVVIRRRAHDDRLEVARDLGYNVTELDGPWFGTAAVERPTDVTR
jgi:hypothetical protein